MRIYVVKRTFQGHFFWSSNFDGSPLPGQLRQEKVVHLKRKPYNVPFESNTETGRIFVMGGSTQVLVKVVLFQLGDVATLRVMQHQISSLILKAFYQGFQMRYHLFLGFFGKMVKNSKKSFPENRGYGLICPPVQFSGFKNFLLYILWVFNTYRAKISIFSYLVGFIVHLSGFDICSNHGFGFYNFVLQPLFVCKIHFSK